MNEAFGIGIKNSMIMRENFYESLKGKHHRPYVLDDKRKLLRIYILGGIKESTINSIFVNLNFYNLHSCLHLLVPLARLTNPLEMLALRSDWY